ncbi:MAG TPA: DUF2269 domain-containing protein [bacterium]|nr:DUF2269 domain-containing protein [bacterium]
MYAIFKFLHLLGVVLFVGNIITAALWKTRADRSGDPATVAFAQRMVARADWIFTLPGVLLVVIGGYAMAGKRPWPLHGLRWLEWGQGLFWLAVLIWVFVLIPTQRRLIGVSEEARRTQVLPAEFARLSRRWAMWGGIATLLPLIVLYLMVAKP